MKILILGAGVDQVQMIKKAKEIGYTVYMADKEEKSIGRKYGDIFINVDPRDTSSLEKIIKEEKIGAVCTMASNLLPRYVSDLARRCNLKAIPYESAILATDKEEFKQIFRDTDIPIVNGGVARSTKEAIQICKQIQLPVIFKPSDGSGCKGIKIVRTLEQVENAFKMSIEYSTSKSIVIEEFLEDSLVFGVESIVNKSETFVIEIADKIVRQSSDISTIGVTIPTILDKREIENVKKTVEKIHRKLGIDMGATHIDFIFHNGVSKVIDIGPRLAGGPLIFELIKNTKNIDMIKYVIEQSIREVPDPVIKDSNKSAVSLHFFSPENGELIDYKIPDLPEGMTLSWRKELGSELKTHGSNITRLGYLTCIDSSINQAKEKISHIIEKIQVKIKVRGGRIEKFALTTPDEFCSIHLN